MNTLFATAEVFPLIKTGGLADMSASLPRALLGLKQDVRILLPAYGEVLNKINKPRQVATTYHYGQEIKILETRLPGTRVKVWLVDCPQAFARGGNPYVTENGEPWPDNAFRFMLFCQTAVDIALNHIGLDWRVDIVHCNDWQAAMIPALLDQFKERPATVFTIHNLAYQGVFPQDTFVGFGLPDELWAPEGVEFHNMFSFIKGGLNFADRINTVSVQYAREIQTEGFGFGLQGLLQHRSAFLTGIQNGIDTTIWNPGSDRLIAQKYNRQNLNKKGINKSELQREFGLNEDSRRLLMGMITRLVSQKGLDILLESMDELLRLPVQLVILGIGEPQYEKRLKKIAHSNIKNVAFVNGYDELLAHRIEAGSDLYLMPSIFEPCGLNQLYSLRYGTLPLVTPVGGLVDAVNDVTRENANGFVMDELSPSGFITSINQALSTFQNSDLWRKLQLNAMNQDHSWKHSAQLYLDLYDRANNNRYFRDV